MDKTALDNLVIRHCSEGELTQVMALEAAVLSQLERPDLLRQNTKEMWASCLRLPHVSIGAWNGTDLVALAVLYIPEEGDGESLAPLLHTIDIKGHRCANFKICLVHPDWRGHHLQVLLGNRLSTEAKARGYDFLCATASPYNAASIKSLLRLGYHVDHKLEKYGFERMVFFYVN